MYSEAWLWKMDYCAAKGWHPGDPGKWEAAGKAYEYMQSSQRREAQRYGN